MKVNEKKRIKSFQWKLSIQGIDSLIGKAKKKSKKR